MKKYLLTLVMTLVLALGCMGSAFAAESNLVGYVDIQRVFRNHPDMQATMSVLNLERQKAQQEFEAKAASLDDKGKQELGKKLTEQVDKKEASLLNPIRASIRKAIGEVAKANGIANVVDASAMIYGGMDLTDQVMAKLTGGK
ncbi:MAG: OmpH family outer membrane protein [Phascolarctobacterium sp.]